MTENTNANQYYIVTICSIEKITYFLAANDTVCIAVISKVVAPAKPEHHAVDLYIETMETIPKADVAVAVGMMRQLQTVAHMQHDDATTSISAA